VTSEFIFLGISERKTPFPPSPRIAPIRVPTSLLRSAKHKLSAMDTSPAESPHRGGPGGTPTDTVPRGRRRSVAAGTAGLEPLLLPLSSHQQRGEAGGGEIRAGQGGGRPGTPGTTTSGTPAAREDRETVGRRLWNSLFGRKRRDASSGGGAPPVAHPSRGQRLRRIDSEEGSLRMEEEESLLPAALEQIGPLRGIPLAPIPKKATPEGASYDIADMEAARAEEPERRTIESRVYFARHVADYVRQSRLDGAEACVQVWDAVSDMVSVSAASLAQCQEQQELLAEQHQADSSQNDSLTGRSSGEVLTVAGPLSASDSGEHEFRPDRSLTVTDVQSAGLAVVVGMVEGQFDTIVNHPLRSTLFEVVGRTDVSLTWKTRLLRALTREGRYVQPFEDRVGVLLSTWIDKATTSSAIQFPDLTRAAVTPSPGSFSSASSDSRASFADGDREKPPASRAPTVSKLSLNDSTMRHLRTVVEFAQDVCKYNFAHLSEGVRAQIVWAVARVSAVHTMFVIALDQARHPQSAETQKNSDGLAGNLFEMGHELLRACVLFFDVIVRYDDVPIRAIPHVLASLCRLVNIEPLTDQSWNTLANILQR
jgi:Domain of unknown function (DUF3384)